MQRLNIFRYFSVTQNPYGIWAMMEDQDIIPNEGYITTALQDIVRAVAQGKRAGWPLDA